METESNITRLDPTINADRQKPTSGTAELRYFRSPTITNAMVLEAATEIAKQLEADGLELVIEPESE